MVEKTENVIIYNQEIFENNFILNDKQDIILNSIKVYKLKKDIPDKEIDYDIKVYDGKQVICPLCNSKKYLIFYKRCAKRKVLKIEAKDYYKRVEKDGNFTFYM